MKKEILIVLLCGSILIGLTGCEDKKETVTSEELNNINKEITEYFSSDNIEYDNFSFNYVDEENKVVIVGLLNNSKENQEKFKKVALIQT